MTIDAIRVLGGLIVVGGCGAFSLMALRVRTRAQREARERVRRDESWASIVATRDAHSDTMSRHAFEVVYPSRGA
jgi:hypothetical protein